MTGSIDSACDDWRGCDVADRADDKCLPDQRSVRLIPALFQLRINANRSALIVLASVVHMPCGNPL